MGSEDYYNQMREFMVENIRAGTEIEDERIFQALSSVPRHFYAIEAYLENAYDLMVLPLNNGATMSEPSLVAMMINYLKLKATDRVLDLGGGSGYHAALIAQIVKDVYSVELIPELYARAKNLAIELGYDNIHFIHGNGFEGYPDMAPYDAINVACSPDHIPDELVAQLKVGGRMIIPLETGNYYQDLLLCKKRKDGTLKKKLKMKVAFVPMKEDN